VCFMNKLIFFLLKRRRTATNLKRILYCLVRFSHDEDTSSFSFTASDISCRVVPQYHYPHSHYHHHPADYDYKARVRDHPRRPRQCCGRDADEYDSDYVSQLDWWRVLREYYQYSCAQMGWCVALLRHENKDDVRRPRHPSCHPSLPWLPLLLRDGSCCCYCCCCCYYESNRS